MSEDGDSSPDAAQAVLKLKPNEEDGAQQLVATVNPRTLDGCRGSCMGARVVLGEGIHELKQVMHDLADLMMTPLEAGPLLKHETYMGQPSESIAKVDKLWELRLCIENLRDILEGHNPEDSDALAAAEALGAVEEAVRRVLALAAQDGANGEFLDMLQAIRAKEISDGRLSNSLVHSKLGISGLLELVLGELTDWQSRPTRAEEVCWQRWDAIHRGLVDASEGAAIPATSARSDEARVEMLRGQCGIGQCCVSILEESGEREIAAVRDVTSTRCFGLFC